MNAAAGANPQAAAVTEVIFAGAKETAEAGPVGIGHGEVGGQKALAGLVEGLDGWWHDSLLKPMKCESPVQRFRAYYDPPSLPTACAMGCILAPLRGFTNSPQKS